MKTVVLSVYIALILQVSSDGWGQFAKVKFNLKFFKEFNEYFMVPSFDSTIKSYEGKELTLEGYYMPIELGNKNTIIISRNPYAQCFFCGGAGPESVSEITFASKPPKFKVDQIIRVSGTLKLNDAHEFHSGQRQTSTRMNTMKYTCILLSLIVLHVLPSKLKWTTPHQ